MKEIDARGLVCPQPVILAKNAIKELMSGTVKIVVDNEAASENLKKFALNNNLRVEIEIKDRDYHVSLTKDADVTSFTENSVTTKGFSEINCNMETEKGTVIVIKSDKFGSGAEELGAILMKSYTFALSESDPLPKELLLLNGGVKLACEGSEVIENLQKISDCGTEIYCCGTCLDFYNLKEKQIVGMVGNMYMFVEKMNEARKVITVG